jgi:large subunit ribosomal protein L30
MVDEVKKAPAKKAAPKKAEAKVAAVKKAAPVAKSSGKKIKVTQIGSTIGRIDQQRDTLIGLGLNKRHRSKILVDSPETRGMIERVKHLVVIEDAA